MVILDEKSLMIPPPPPYVEAGPISPPPFPSDSRAPPTLSTLPPHLLLRIVYETFSNGRVEKQRKLLYWLTMSLRLVNRSVYIGEFPFFPSRVKDSPSHLSTTVLYDSPLYLGSHGQYCVQVFVTEARPEHAAIAWTARCTLVKDGRTTP